MLAGGLLVGALATAYFLGAPRSRSLPGTPLRPPDSSVDTSGTVAVTIDEKFFDSLLGTIFTKLGPPQLKLSAAPQGSCSDVVVLDPAAGDVKTSVRFTGGKIVAPLAFSGSYSILAQCMQIKGTGRATVELSFDASKQTVFGALNVEDVVLEGVPPIVTALAVAFVRRAIAERLNPFPVLPVSQLAISLPVQQSGGNVKATVKDVRSEIQEGAVKLFLVYDFSGEKQ